MPPKSEAPATAAPATTAQALGSAAQVRARHHAQGQGPERRPRPAAAAHLDHVPEVPRRPGDCSARRRRRSPARSSARPSSRPTAGATGRRTRRASRATSCSPSSTGRGRPARRQARPGPVRLPARADERERRRPPRRHRHRLPGRRQPDAERLPAARRHQQGRGHPLHVERGAAHAGRALRVHAARDARRGRRLGRVLHAAPVVRFMVAVTDPRLGETVLDPACGTGGFLVEAFNHLATQVKTVGGPQGAPGAVARSAASRSRCRICCAR